MAENSISDQATATAARDQLLALFTNAARIVRIGGHFTCTEAERIAAWLRLEASPAAAEGWLCAHAVGDDDLDDLHRDRITAPILDGPPVTRRIPRPEDTMTSPLPCTAVELAQARDELASVLDSPWLARDIGAHLTRRQAETIEGWLRTVRGDHAARSWREGRALSVHTAHPPARTPLRPPGRPGNTRGWSGRRRPPMPCRTRPPGPLSTGGVRPRSRPLMWALAAPAIPLRWAPPRAGDIPV